MVVRTLQRNGVVVGSSAALRVPMTLGWIRPRILLPECSQLWRSTGLEAVLAHELTHIQRRDYLFTLDGALNQCIYWFHPLALFLPRTLAALSEHA